MSATDSPDTTTTTGTTRQAEGGRFTRDDAAAAPLATTPASGRATAALILGILSIPAALIPILGVALGVIGLVLGITARSDMRRTAGVVTGKVKAAIVLSCIGIGLAILLWIASAAAIISNNS
jgi:hypothetical protein